jgi:hypothetical protein
MSTGADVASAAAIARRCFLRRTDGRVLVAALPQAHAAEGVLGAFQHLVHGQAQILERERCLSRTDPVTICASGSWNTVLTSRLSSATGVVAVSWPRTATVPVISASSEQDQPAERERERGLAGSGRAQEEYDLAGVHIEGDVADRGIARAAMRDREIAHAAEAGRRAWGSVRKGCLGKPNLVGLETSGCRASASVVGERSTPCGALARGRALRGATPARRSEMPMRRPIAVQAIGPSTASGR